MSQLGPLTDRLTQRDDAAWAGSLARWLSRAARSVSDARPCRHPPVPGSGTLGGSPDGGGALDQLIEAVLGVPVPRVAGVRVRRIPTWGIGVVWAGWCPDVGCELLEAVALVLPGPSGGVDVAGWGEPRQAGGLVEVDPPLRFLGLQRVGFHEPVMERAQQNAVG